MRDYIDVPRFYPAGRLDKDSEGLLILTDNGALQHQLTDPKNKQAKTYWVQVENSVSPAAIHQLKNGVMIKSGKTLPAEVKTMPAPTIWQREVPIRSRANIPTQWLEIKIREGKNRQIRRMTASVGHPTLRLLRVAIGSYQLGDLPSGKWRFLSI